MTIPTVIACATIMILSYILSLVTRKHAIADGVIDTPNHRSSHTIPTPRGGGLSIAAVSLVVVLLLTMSRNIPVRTGLALLVGGSAIATVGWLDDKHGLSARLRFMVHIASAIWALIMLGGLPSMRIGSTVLRSPILLSVLAAIGIGWSTNLFNFMDGIDGIAGVQTVCIGFGGGLLLKLTGEIGLARCMLALGAAALGFLIPNWHPAKIFMGDVGSGFIGFFIATVAIASENTSAVPLLLWLLMMAVFAVDATATLACRTIKGHPWSEAHRTHVYQLAVRSGLSHDRVSIIVGVVNCVLIGVAYLGVKQPDCVGVITGATLASVFVAWLWLRHRLQLKVANTERSGAAVCQGVSL